MQPNPNDPMNGLLRRAGNRSRMGPGPGPTALPNIGQTPAVQAANVVQQQRQQPLMSPSAPSLPAATAAPSMPSSQPAASNPLAAPAVQPTTMTLHPPGTPADPNQYNYSPEPDGAWRVYPPGIAAPNHTISASLPRAASTADYRRMRQAFEQTSQTPPA